MPGAEGAGVTAMGDAEGAGAFAVAGGASEGSSGSRPEGARAAKEGVDKVGTESVMIHSVDHSSESSWQPPSSS